MPANPGHNDLDEQKHGYDGQKHGQIKIFFRHCPCVSVKGQSNAGAAVEWGQELRRLGEAY